MIFEQMKGYELDLITRVMANTLGGRMSIRVLPASFLIDLHFWSPKEKEICTLEKYQSGFLHDATKECLLAFSRMAL